MNQSVSNLRAPKTKLVTRIDTVEMLMENMRYDMAAIRKDFAVQNRSSIHANDQLSPDKALNVKVGNTTTNNANKKQVNSFGELVQSQLDASQMLKVRFENKFAEVERRLNRIDDNREHDLRNTQQFIKEFRTEIVNRPTFESLTQQE